MAGLDSYTKLLLHCDGADASTTFVDSATGKSVAVSVGSAQLDTAQYKFGTASLLLANATSDQIRTADHDDFNFGSGDFTVDFWIRIAADPAASRGILSQNNAGYFRIAMITGSKIYWDCNAGSAERWALSGNTVIANNAWTHVACIRYGNVQTIYVGGVAQAATGAYAGSLDNLTDPFNIGYDAAFGTLSCWLDEIRVSKGIARWTANFTPPASPYGLGGGFSGGQPWIF
jgi:hypothetical protein